MVTGPKAYIPGPGVLVTRYVIFLSSESELMEQRDLFESMVKTVDAQFRLHEDPDRPFVLVVERWEDDAPLKTPGDARERYAQRAREANLTFVLLWKKLLPGTLMEIEAALEEDEVQLAVVWMQEPGAARSRSKLAKFLRENGHKFQYVVTGPPGSPEATCAMLRVIARVLADVTHGDRRQEPFHESR
jgi:hypothetical protein